MTYGPRDIAFPSIREQNSDNGKRNPSNGLPRAAHTAPAFWPKHMGAWDAPGVEIIQPEHDGGPMVDGDGDEPQITFDPGTQAYNPISVWDPDDFNGSQRGANNVGDGDE